MRFLLIHTHPAKRARGTTDHSFDGQECVEYISGFEQKTIVAIELSLNAVSTVEEH